MFGEGYGWKIGRGDEGARDCLSEDFWNFTIDVWSMGFLDRWLIRAWDDFSVGGWAGWSDDQLQQ